MPVIDIKQLHGELDEYARRLGLPPAPENFFRDILTTEQRRQVKSRLDSGEHIVRIWASLQEWTEIQACVDLARRLLSLREDRVVSLLRDLKQRPLVSPPRPQCKPRWDKDSGQLTLDGVLCRQFNRSAENCVAILDAFEQQNWVKRIEDPFGGDPEKRAQAIRSLNNKCQYIAFRGSDKGIVWEYAATKEASSKLRRTSKSASKVKQNTPRKPRPR